MLKRSTEESIHLMKYVYFINDKHYITCDRYFLEGPYNVLYLPFKDKNNIIYHPESNTIY